MANATYQPEIIKAEFDEFEWDLLEEVVYNAQREAEPFTAEATLLKDLMEKIEGLTPLRPTAFAENN